MALLQLLQLADFLAIRVEAELTTRLFIS